MKKLLILLILTFTSCCDIDNHKDTRQSIKTAYTELIQEENQVNLRRINQALHKVEFSGHSYIIFHNARVNSSAVFMLHDPDCQCKL